MVGGFSQKYPFKMTADTDCRVRGSMPNGLILHDCAVRQGISGAPLLKGAAETNVQIIGLHVATSVDEAVNQSAGLRHRPRRFTGGRPGLRRQGKGGHPIASQSWWHRHYKCGRHQPASRQRQGGMKRCETCRFFVDADVSHYRRYPPRSQRTEAPSRPCRRTGGAGRWVDRVHH
jgi:hypothetical protein